MGIHSSLAAMTKNDLWELTDEEAAKLADAAAKVQAEYGLVLDSKTEAWLRLMGVAGSVYGSRIGVAMALKASAKEAAKRKAQLQTEKTDDFVRRTEEAVMPNTPIQPVAPVSARPGFAPAPTASHPHMIYPRGQGGAQN